MFVSIKVSFFFLSMSVSLTVSLSGFYCRNVKEG